MKTYTSGITVIGGGIAGIACALEVLDRGGSVVLIDRHDRENMGGLARDSFGGIFMVDTPVQRRAGIKDSVDLAFSDWKNFAGFEASDVWPEKWARKFVEESREHVYKWLKKRSIDFFPVVHWVERGFDVPGNSLPRFHMVWGTGYGLMETLKQVLFNHKNKDRLTLLNRHRVDSIDIGGDTARGVSGIDEMDGSSFSCKSDAVVIASGGIAGNHDLVRKHWYRPWGQPPEKMLNGSHPFADGAMHLAAKKAGASVTHLDKLWNYAAGVIHPEPTHENHGLSLVPTKSALWMDAYGRRMGPLPLVSGFDTRHLVAEVCKTEKKYSWQVMNWKIAVKELAVSGSHFNDAIRDKKKIAFIKTALFGNPGLVKFLTANCPDFVTASTPGELAQKMNSITEEKLVDGGLLTEEIRKYDSIIDRGPSYFNDDQLRRIAHLRQYRGDRVRTCKFQKILDKRAMPLIAVKLSILTRKTLGGIQTDLESRVLKSDGRPIQGLFAAGESAGFGGGGIHGLRALEGTFLASCIVTGRTAARSILA